MTIIEVKGHFVDSEFPEIIERVLVNQSFSVSSINLC